MNSRLLRTIWPALLLAAVPVSAWGNSILSSGPWPVAVESGSTVFQNTETDALGHTTLIVNAVVDYAVFRGAQIPASLRQDMLPQQGVGASTASNFVPGSFNWATDYIYTYQIHAARNSYPITSLAVVYLNLTPVTGSGFYDSLSQLETLIPGTYVVEEDAAKFIFPSVWDPTAVLFNNGTAAHSGDSSVLWFSSPLSPGEFPSLLWDHGTHATGELPSPLFITSGFASPVPLPPAVWSAGTLLAVLGLGVLARARRANPV